MLFIWEDGSTKEIPLGYKCVGMKRNNRRPEHVKITIQEIAKLLESRSFEDIDTYIHKVVIPALTYKDSTDINDAVTFIY